MLKTQKGILIHLYTCVCVCVCVYKSKTLNLYFKDLGQLSMEDAFVLRQDKGILKTSRGQYYIYCTYRLG